MTTGGSPDYVNSEFRCLTLVALCPDPEAFEGAVFNLTDSLGYVSTEDCTYFNVIRGELKIKVAKPNQNKVGELIAYKRTETSIDGVYLAEGSYTYVQDVDFLQSTLRVALSELGTIRAKRRVFVKDNIRINLDDLEDLGIYVEIDLGISSSQPSQVDLDLIQDIRKQLGIKDNQLLPYSYLEIYRNLKLSDSGLDDESNQSDY
ncbi:hypothetical protein FO519_004628 [Halicephalobus sp. NKZ332]|nr:hypothetical protein FO519_004628 [Halicephalobus sp. NKZ332]